MGKIKTNSSRHSNLITILRLDPKQAVQIFGEDRLSQQGKMAIAHYRLEAIFYENSLESARLTKLR